MQQSCAHNSFIQTITIETRFSDLLFIYKRVIVLLNSTYLYVYYCSGRLCRVRGNLIRNFDLIWPFRRFVVHNAIQICFNVFGWLIHIFNMLQLALSFVNLILLFYLPYFLNAIFDIPCYNHIKGNVSPINAMSTTLNPSYYLYTVYR